MEEEIQGEYAQLDNIRATREQQDNSPCCIVENFMVGIPFLLLIQVFLCHYYCVLNKEYVGAQYLL